MVQSATVWDVNILIVVTAGNGGNIFAKSVIVVMEQEFVNIHQKNTDIFTIV